MIFDQSSKKVAQVVGEVKNNNVGIDANNLDFIVTILSTNLYSKPIESFIRETVSNAWDSHVEAGVGTPVILELSQNSEGQYSCRIQDFGVGLSKERFDTIYKNIGSSTKRGSNDQIGGFGIGRFAALAYSDVVHITSVHNGTKCYYMMYKDGNSLSIDLINEFSTNERNGVEVKIDVKKYDVVSFFLAIENQLSYFENLYLSTNSEDYRERVERFNSLKFKKFKNFSMNTMFTTRPSLLLGKVKYPIRTTSLTIDYTRTFETTPVALNFEIGDLQVTPNREEIQYTPEAIAKIEAKIKATTEELQEITSKLVSKDTDNLEEYVENLNSESGVKVFEEIRVPSYYAPKKAFTLNGICYDRKDFLRIHSEMMKQDTLSVSAIVLDGKILRKVSFGTNVRKLKVYPHKIHTCSDFSSLSAVTKRYLRDEMEDNVFLKPMGRKDLLNLYKKICKRVEVTSKYRSTYRDSFNFNMKISKVIFKEMAKTITSFQEFSNDSVPKSYIAADVVKQKAKRAASKLGQSVVNWKENIKLYTVEMSQQYGAGILGTKTEGETVSLEDLAKIKKRVIYAAKDSKRLREYFLLNRNINHNYRFVEVAPTKLKHLKNLENFIPLEKFDMNLDYKLIRDFATVSYINENVPHLNELSNISNLKDISTKLCLVTTEIKDFCRRYEGNFHRSNMSDLISELYELAKEKGYFNLAIKGVVDDNLEMLKNAEVLTFMVEKDRYCHQEKIPENRVNILVDYLLARKLVRPSLVAVKKLRKETIFNLNTENDENN